MSKAKHLFQNKFSFIRILSLEFLVLGIVCICWALANIGGQSHKYTDAYAEAAYLKPSQSPVALKAKPARLTEDSVNPVESENIDITGSVSKSELQNYDKILYPVYPSGGDSIGTLSIPILKQAFPIIQGTGADDLKKGVGHFMQSVLPGENDNCVLSGHRDTVFAKLGKLKIGDQLITETSAGIFTYKISNIRIVDKDDRTVIVPADHAVLTLTTCYPFLFIGSAPSRYIISADLVTGE